jgi:hypothetical protein
MSATALVWDMVMRQTIPERFSVQRSVVRGEGVCYELWVGAPEDAAAAKALSLETAYYGSHGFRSCRRQAQRIADHVAATVQARRRG